MKRDVIVDGNDYNGRNTENTQSLMEESLPVNDRKTETWNTCMPKKAQEIGRKVVIS